MDRRTLIATLPLVAGTACRPLSRTLPQGRVFVGMRSGQLLAPWHATTDRRTFTLGGPSVMLYGDDLAPLAINLMDGNSAAIVQAASGSVWAVSVLPNGPGITAEACVAFAMLFRAWFNARGLRDEPDSRASISNGGESRWVRLEDAEAVMADSVMKLNEIGLVGLTNGRVRASVSANNGRRRDARWNAQVRAKAKNEAKRRDWRLMIDISDSSLYSHD